jgi:uncharacterized protein (TIGR02594 family)
MRFPPPPWLATAYAELGVAGPPRVDEYLASINLPGGAGHAWCAGFVHWTLASCGIRGTGLGTARSYATWGEPSPIRLGAIAVLWRDDPASWKGHVGFLVTTTATELVLLGGNQDERVCLKGYPRDRLLALRGPENAGGRPRPPVVSPPGGP